MIDVVSIMGEWLIAFFAFVAGWIAATTWSRATSGWKRGRGMLKAPEQARAERAQMKKKARAEASKGRGELFRAMVLFIVIAAILFLLALVIGMFSGL